MKESCSWLDSYGAATGCNGKWECDIPKILDRETQVDAGRFGGAVAEQIADCFQRSALAKQVDRERMAKAVGAMERDRESAPKRPDLKYVANGGWFEGAGGSSAP